VAALGAVAAFVIFAVGVFWALWLPHFRPALRSGEAYGVDVSVHQGAIDWASVKRDHIAFAYIKASEGADLIDRRFATNWSAAHTAGVQRGAYHFFTLCTPAAAQAANFLRVVGSDLGELAPAVDLELTGNCSQRPDRATVRREITDFVRRVERGMGRPALLYVGDSFERRYPVRATLYRSLWQRKILHRPTGSDWVVWQVQNRAHVDGVHGNVDLDVMRAGAGLAPLRPQSRATGTEARRRSWHGVPPL